VGLVPLAIGGFDVRSLIKGGVDMEKSCSSTISFGNNPAALYAAARYMLYRSGKKIEILANFENKLHFFAEWWKQLYGESEGKEGKGIYPASVDFTSDLHSMGQYIQEGERILMETVISLNETSTKLLIPSAEEDLDGLNYLAGKRLDAVNKMAELGTMLAHVDGQVPNIHITVPRLNEYYLGQLMYFFEKACGISGYLLGVNPFDQPGVEAYKKNMFALLEKPGFEEATKKIKSRI
jgi:glucose-6-phosphate isomerase